MQPRVSLENPRRPFTSLFAFAQVFGRSCFESNFTAAGNIWSMVYELFDTCWRVPRPSSSWRATPSEYLVWAHTILQPAFRDWLPFSTKPPSRDQTIEPLTSFCGCSESGASLQASAADAYSELGVCSRLDGPVKRRHFRILHAVL